MVSSVSLSTFIDQCCSQVDNALSTVLPVKNKVSPRLLEAVRYSIFNGGKRIRPTLVYASCHALGGDLGKANPAACAVELIHAYSLVHDDLPAMDNDNIRRGKPTCHRAYDEATAILSGDSIHSLAFEVLSNVALFPESMLTDTIRLQWVHILSQASGLSGMAGGQSMDLCSMGSTLNQEELELMHSHKTGALIGACVHMGALCGRPVQKDEQYALDCYARAIGLAFQVRDDILDVISDTETLGKNRGSDMMLDKPTYVSMMGLEKAKAYTEQLHDKAVSALAGFDHSTDFLRQIADYIIRRKY